MEPVADELVGRTPDWFTIWAEVGDRSWNRARFCVSDGVRGWGHPETDDERGRLDGLSG